MSGMCEKFRSAKEWVERPPSLQRTGIIPALYGISCLGAGFAAFAVSLRWGLIWDHVSSSDHSTTAYVKMFSQAAAVLVSPYVGAQATNLTWRALSGLQNLRPVVD